ncbi:MAG: hypothetical protein K2P58_00840 [Hyphomonadaceae bacterium]|nr:hypothetical protein [Hyphomonadaceae bacterium]
MTGRSYRGAPLGPGEVPALERVSRDLVVAAGLERGVSFRTVYWDDPQLPSHFDAAIIRSCWDYHERGGEFVAALEAHEGAGLRVHNSSRIIRWNGQKTYLKQLGPLAIDTVWVERADAHAVAKAFDALDASEIVVKPQVGAGSIGTLRLKRNGWSEADLIAGPNGAAMIQPFLRSIETEGERSLFWFGGAYSHAIRKVPHAGAWLANIPSKATFAVETPPTSAMEVAEAARAHAPEAMLYVRVDLVQGDDGRWRVIEVEAIEPYLFLDFAPEAAGRFVDAIARVLS